MALRPAIFLRPSGQPVSSLRWTLVRTAMLAVLGLVGLLTLLASLIYWRTYVSREQQFAQTYVRALHGIVESYQRQPEMQLGTVAKLMQVPGAQPHLQAILDSVHKQQPYALSLLLLDSNARLNLASPASYASPGIYYDSLPVVRQALRLKRPCWSTAYVNPTTGHLATTLALPLPKGLLLAELSLEHFKELALPPEITDKASLYITDQQGTYIYHEDSTLIGSQATQAWLYNLGQGRPDSVLQGTFTDEGHMQLHYYASTLPYSGWRVIIIQTRAMLYYPLYTAFVWLAGFALLACLAATLGALLFTRKAFAPIAQLNERIQLFAAGEDPSETPVGIYAEFQDTSELFASMAAQVRDRETQLAQANAELRHSLDQQQRVEQAFTATLRTASRSTGRHYCLDAVQSLCEWLHADWSLILTLEEDEPRLLVQWTNQQPESEIAQLLASGLPRRILAEGYCALDEVPLTGFRSAVGIAVRDDSGRNLGLLLSLGLKPLAQPPRTREILEVLAVRTGAEIARLQVDRSLRSLTKDLRNKNRDLEDMLYIYSHDLRTPLVSIAGFARELEQGASQAISLLANIPEVPPGLRSLLGEEFPESLRFIRQGIGRLDALQKGLMTLSRLTRDPLSLQDVDLGELLYALQAELAPRLLAVGASLYIGPMPRLHADASALTQLFFQLLDNALKYTRPDTTPLIGIRCEVQGKLALVKVTDNGRGIEPQHLPKLFSTFYRAVSPDEISGEGLGLPIAQRIAEKHHGRIAVESIPGQGSTFLVRLPVT